MAEDILLLIITLNSFPGFFLTGRRFDFIEPPLIIVIILVADCYSLTKGVTAGRLLTGCLPRGGFLTLVSTAVAI